ncbi:MAG: tetratricopeptide repeat protein [Clostridia bacterium]|nr:tetratricopeptide repeat protein [Clostridia bacterium]
MPGYMIILIALIGLFVLYFISRPLFFLAIAALIVYLIYLAIPNVYIMNARKAFSDGDYKKAIKFYKKAIATNRVSGMAKIDYAYTLMRIGELDRALSVIERVISEDKSKNNEIRNAAIQNRCMIYYKQGAVAKALADAYKMFNEGYKNSNLYAMIGYFKLLNNEPINEVTRFCEEAYEYNGDNRDIIDNLSICYYKQGKYEEARKLSDKILESNQKFVEAYYHGAQIALKCGDVERAKELAGKIDGCNRSFMTSVSVEEVNKLKSEVGI